LPGVGVGTLFFSNSIINRRKTSSADGEKLGFLQFTACPDNAPAKNNRWSPQCFDIEKAIDPITKQKTGTHKRQRS
jgi:hypothetical protein